ncbi:MAG: nickel pincer cofactor biosynthesis protein LarC [Candidatus Heimdallarchaeota archaeon]|nr:nickel pincer cofactor biosynthesis protein LarC [Candidatus Heimdallarchaeota archaeon]
MFVTKDMQTLAVDCALAGASGDMILAALIELYRAKYGHVEAVTAFIQELNSHLKTPISLDFEEIAYKDFKGTRLILQNTDISLDIDAIKNLLNTLMSKSSKKIQALCSYIFDLLVDAEKEVHGHEHIHLHELGTVDTVIDICMTMRLIEELHIEQVLLSPIALGQGIVTTEHGLLPVPAPSSDIILQQTKLRTVPGPEGGEAATPTGIAIIAGLDAYFDSAINVVWKSSALGFGTKQWNDRGNYIRLRLGTLSHTASSISILETNVDDVTGEILGETMEVLLGEGALDVSFYPIFMKKNRPAYCLRVISTRQDEERIAELIQQHTGTLGVRVQHSNRHIGKREKIQKTIHFRGKEIQFSIKQGPFRSKIEFDDLRRLSRELGIPVLELRELLMEEIQ